MAMLEHAAAGAACVCPNTMCYPETLRGTYLAPPDEDGLADAICELAADPEKLSKIQSKSQEQADRYPIQATVQGITRLFDR